MIELDTKHLKALLICVPNNEVRYYLCGVNFAAKDSKVTAHATDGHRISKWLITDTYEGEDFNLIVSKDAIKYALAAKDATVTLHSDGDIVTSMGTARGLIDGKYPDVERVLNRKTAENKDGSCFINTKYIADVIKIANLLCMKRLPNKYRQVNSSPDKTVLFTFTGVDDFIHGVMPLRGEHIDSEETTFIEKILN